MTNGDMIKTVYNMCS